MFDKKRWWDRANRQIVADHYRMFSDVLKNSPTGRVTAANFSPTGPAVIDDIWYGLTPAEQAFDKAVKAIHPPWQQQWERATIQRDVLMANCERLRRSKKLRHKSQCYERVWARYLLEKISC